MHSRKRERSVVEAWRRHSPGGSSRGAILQALAAREIAPARAGPSGAAAWGSLACFGVESEFDMHDPEALRLFRLPQLRRRSKVIEIVCSDDVVVALTLSGVACAFKDGRRVAFLNVTPDEMVRSVLFNRRSASFVTVSTYRADHFSSLHCRSTLVEWVRRGEPEAGLPIFQQEELRWPGFVEFDEVSCRAVTFSAADRTYGIWELANFSLLFRLRDPEIAEVKAAARNALLVVHRRKADAMRVQVLSIADGTSLLGSESPVINHPGLSAFRTRHRHLAVRPRASPQRRARVPDRALRRPSATRPRHVHDLSETCPVGSSSSTTGCSCSKREGRCASPTCARAQPSRREIEISRDSPRFAEDARTHARGLLGGGGAAAGAVIDAAPLREELVPRGEPAGARRLQLAGRPAARDGVGKSRAISGDLG